MEKPNRSCLSIHSDRRGRHVKNISIIHTAPVRQVVSEADEIGQRNVTGIPIRRGKSCRFGMTSRWAEGIRADGHRGFAASNRGISLVNFKRAYGRNASANHLSLFARKPQIPLAFVPEESNGYDVLKGA
jgi:hypothetical protein